MSLVKVSGAWKTVTAPFVKVAGAWKPVIQEWVKVSGAWVGAFISIFDLTGIRGTLTNFGGTLSLATNGVNGQPGGLFVRDDGTLAFTVDVFSGAADVKGFTLATAHRFDTATEVSALEYRLVDVSVVGSIAFKPDGTKMYVGTGASGTRQGLLEYTLSTAWDPSTATYEGNTIAPGSRIGGIQFDPTGSRVILILGGSGSNVLNEYDLSTPWDTSTASGVAHTLTIPGQDFSYFLVSNDGLRVYTEDDNSDMRETTLASAFTLDGASSTRTSGFPTRWIELSDVSVVSMALSGSGEYVHIINTDERAYSVQTSVADTFTVVADPTVKKLSISGTIATAPAVSDDETVVIYLNRNTDTIEQRNLSTAGDITTAGAVVATYDASALSTFTTSMTISRDGTHLYIAASDTDLFYEFSLSTAWDVTTITNTGRTFSFSGQTSFMSDIYVADDGSKMYAILETPSTPNVYQYAMSTPYDLSTMSYEKAFALTSPDNGVNAFGSVVVSQQYADKMHVIWDRSVIDQYSLSTPGDIATASRDAVYYPMTEASLSPNQMRFNNRGTRIYTGDTDQIASIQLK